jgi:hypothetical protein
VKLAAVCGFFLAAPSSSLLPLSFPIAAFSLSSFSLIVHSLFFPVCLPSCSFTFFSLLSSPFPVSFLFHASCFTQ